jgi:Putative zinc-finger
MIRLNCKRMARMMPLYVAGDLSAARLQKAAQHLRACEACRELADEFHESKALLAEGCSMPEFDAEFYAEIRNAVLGKIKLERSLPKRTVFGRPWVYATSLAIIVIMSGFVLLRYGSHDRPNSLTLTPPVAGLAVPTATGPDSPSRQVLSNDSNHRHAARLSGRQLKAIRRTSPLEQEGEIARVKPSVREVEPVPPQSVTISGEPLATVSGDANQVSRIEIQTADPNIRIIWFGPQGREEGEQPTHDQIKQENRK